MNCRYFVFELCSESVCSKMEDSYFTEEKKIEVCRLCLDIVNNENVYFLDDVAKNVLEVIIPHLNLNVTHDPKICQTCNKSMFACHEFKSICDRQIIKTEVKIEENTEVYDTPLEQKCDLCLNNIDDQIENNSYSQCYNEELQKDLPKWILTRNINCKNCLEAQYKFLNGCLETEDKIKKYCLVNGIDMHEQVNLYEVLHFVLMSKNETLNGGDSICNSFSEILPDDSIQKLVGDEYLIKKEEIYIKSEETSDEISTHIVEQEQELKKQVPSRSQKEHSSHPNEVYGFYKTSSFKACLVPTCVNNTLISSEKIFLTVPQDHRREGWCTAIEQGIGEKLHWQETAKYYVCEDHFNLKEDMENYVYPYKMIDGKIFLKAGVIPHVFKCLESKKRKNTNLKELIKKPKESNISDVEYFPQIKDYKKRSIGIQVNLDLIDKCSVGTQVEIAIETRSFGTDAINTSSFSKSLQNVSQATTSTVTSKTKRTLKKGKKGKSRK